MPRAVFFAVILLLVGCTSSHLHIAPKEGAIAYLLESTSFDDRNGEYLRETYRPTAIDGKVLRPPWSWGISERQFAVAPGPHKIIGRVAIKRGNALEGWLEYHGVINATFSQNRRYRLNGVINFADNQLDLWIEDAETGTKVSERLSLDLSNPVQRPNIVTYPIYIPTVKTGR